MSQVERAGEGGTFEDLLTTKVREQLKGRNLGYLLGAGSSYLNGSGYPLTAALWGMIKPLIPDVARAAEIQAKLDGGATGLEHALDLLDDGGAADPPHRALVVGAISQVFMTCKPDVKLHVEFVKRISRRPAPATKIFSLNYDLLIEWAGELARVRIVDGYSGHGAAFFEPALFDEQIGRIRGSFKGRQFQETVRPIQLYKLHGSICWYECTSTGVRRHSHGCAAPADTKPLMVPPQRRKANETMLPPYGSLWSNFRSAMGQGPASAPLNRLAAIGYGFGDEHVNTVIESALAQPNFSLMIFTKELSAAAWKRWSVKPNAIVVTETQCSLNGVVGPGHADLWSFERLSSEV